MKRGKPNGVMEGKEQERAIEEFHSNILSCKKRTFSTKILFELIYNPYFNTSLFVISVARNSEFSCHTSILLL